MRFSWKLTAIGKWVEFLGFIDYLEPIGTGKPVRTSSKLRNWTSLNPYAKDEMIWRIACLGQSIANAPELPLVFRFQSS